MAFNLDNKFKFKLIFQAVFNGERDTRQLKMITIKTNKITSLLIFIKKKLIKN